MATFSSVQSFSMSSRRMRASAERALMMPVTFLQCRLSASVMGQMRAMPTPPPIATAWS